MSFSRAESALLFRASTLDGDLTRKRLRERYIAIQFPDYLAVKHDSAAIVRLARELYDDGEKRLSTEVLLLAAQEKPTEKSFVLALLELAYLADDASLYCAAATVLRDKFPRAAEHATVTALGRHIAPRHAQFFTRADDGQSGTGGYASPYTIPGWSLKGSTDTDGSAQAEFRRHILGDAHAGSAT
jgi:hypothetical protein